MFVFIFSLLILFISLGDDLRLQVGVVWRGYPMMIVRATQAGRRTSLGSHIPFLIGIARRKAAAVCFWIWHNCKFVVEQYSISNNFCASLAAAATTYPILGKSIPVIFRNRSTA
jgi:hypothetical protein